MLSFLSRRFAAVCLLALCGVLAAADLRAADPATFTISSFTFKRPAQWQWVPVTSSMRKAQLHVADPADPTGPGADVVFFYFGAGQGGDVNGNISRWIGQFEHPEAVKPVVESADIKGSKVTRVRVDSGTFNSGMPGGPTTPQTDYGLYGAILESKEGNVFIKLTGPAATVRAAAKDFEALVQSPF